MLVTLRGQRVNPNDNHYLRYENVLGWYKIMSLIKMVFSFLVEAIQGMCVFWKAWHNTSVSFRLQLKNVKVLWIQSHRLLITISTCR